MDGKQKQSQFGVSTFATMKAANAEVSVFVANLANKRIPLSDLAGNADLESVAQILANVKDFVAAEYNANTGSYVKNNIVWHNGKVYRANDSTSGAWDSSKWDEVPLSSLVSVDSVLSSTSERPVQNKAIYAVIGDVESLLAAL